MTRSLELPPVPEALLPIFDWFEERVRTLSDAYAGLERRVADLDSQLERRNAELESLLDSLHDGVLMVDVEERVTMVNGRASEAAGPGSAGSGGQNLSDVFPAQGDFTEPLLQSLAARACPCATSRSSGRVPWEPPCRWASPPPRWSTPQGAGSGAVASFSDLTHLKQMERELSQTRTLAALGEMAATVAHEIRNPLGRHRRFRAVAREGHRWTDPRRGPGGSDHRGGRSPQRIVSNLLVYTRPMETRHRIVDVEIGVAGRAWPSWARWKPLRWRSR
jgi:transcriptional regulator with PAS, ATPase and Fis domain